MYNVKVWTSVREGNEWTEWNLYCECTVSTFKEAEETFMDCRADFDEMGLTEEDIEIRAEIKNLETDITVNRSLSDKLEIWALSEEKEEILYYETDELSGIREAREIFREFNEVWDERGIESWVVHVWATFTDGKTGETRRL